MATFSLSTCSSTSPLFVLYLSIPYKRFYAPLSSTYNTPFSSLNLHRSFLSPPSDRNTRPVLSRSAIRPPDSDPPPEKNLIPFTGIASVFSKFQNRVQIFFAVLFWMSLFFWTSAWDGRNRPNKGSRFRR